MTCGAGCLKWCLNYNLQPFLRIIMLKRIFCLFFASVLTLGLSGSLDARSSEGYKPPCDTSITSICTIEIWLAHKQKKKDKEIRQFLKDKSIKVLRRTIQYWRPKGGHPPANLAIGSAVSAEDARMIIDLALQYNDRVELLILRPLNPPNYAAIATSAWDELSQIPITPENLEALRDPSLTTEQFQALYAKLTKEDKMVKNKF